MIKALHAYNELFTTSSSPVMTIWPENRAFIRFDKGLIFESKHCNGTAWCCKQFIVWICKHNIEYSLLQYWSTSHRSKKGDLILRILICITKPLGFFNRDYKDYSLPLSYCVTYSNSTTIRRNLLPIKLISSVRESSLWSSSYMYTSKRSRDAEVHCIGRQQPVSFNF